MYLFIYLYIMERLVSAVFGDPQAQSKNLFVQKLQIKIKKTEAFTLTMFRYLWAHKYRNSKQYKTERNRFYITTA
jgi:hypothetical protein